jgi:hypothetical protein
MGVGRSKDNRLELADGLQRVSLESRTIEEKGDWLPALI